MKLSMNDMDIQEIDLSEIKGGMEIIYSGMGKDARTGKMFYEYISVDENDDFTFLYYPV